MLNLFLVSGLAGLKPALETKNAAVGSQDVVAVWLDSLVSFSTCAIGHKLSAACVVDVWGPSSSKC
jgi:hypothetical protein